MKFILFTILVALVVSHGYLHTPTARSGINANLRTAPCGAANFNSPQGIQAEYAPGDTINVAWKANANHGDAIIYRICYDEDATSATAITNCLETLGTQTNGGGTTPDATSFTLDSDKTCERCTLQMDWTNGGGWYGCTDIRIAKPCSDDCNGKGSCNADGSCECEDGYSGAACEIIGAGGVVTDEEKTAGSIVALTLVTGSAIAGAVVYMHYNGKMNVSVLEKLECPTAAGGAAAGGAATRSRGLSASQSDWEVESAAAGGVVAGGAVAAGAIAKPRKSKPRPVPPRSKPARAKPGPSSRPSGPPQSRGRRTNPRTRRTRGRRAGGRRRGPPRR